MTESGVRGILGLYLVVSQFAVILTTVWAYLRGGLKFDEMTTAVALLVPMFAVHTTTVVKYFVANKNTTTVQRIPVNLPFVFLSFFFPILFVASLISVILLKAYAIGFASFDQFKGSLGLVQTCFAVYIGLFISSLYENSAKNTPSGTSDSPTPNTETPSR